MEITWWGTAGFKIKSNNHFFLIDPFLTRNTEARPTQYLKADEITEGRQIFISHGHFDHVFDIPVIADESGAKVFCSKEVGATLRRQGLGRKWISVILSDESTIDFGTFKAQAFFSKHVKYDIRLLLTTLLRANYRLFRFLPLLNQYPCGQVLSWRFFIEDKTIHFFGSGGSPAEEMEKLSSLPTDILMVPLQGHSNICDIALEYVQVMRPKIVIPHHQDNFFPPISTEVDISPFIEGVKRECPTTEVRVMRLNETLVL